MKPSVYVLEVYEPGSTDTAWAVFESPTPFMTIARGDIVNPGTWPGSQSPMKVAVVTQVEHIVWEGPGGEAKHKLCVYVREVENTRELRMGNES